MHLSSSPASYRCVPHAPVFPPIPSEAPETPASHPLPLYCPTRSPRRRKWGGVVRDGMLQMAGGAVSVGHGVGSSGNEGTAEDRGTGAPGSNLTRDDKTPDQPEGIDPPSQADKQQVEEKLLDGTQRGPAQPR